MENMITIFVDTETISDAEAAQEDLCPDEHIEDDWWIR